MDTSFFMINIFVVLEDIIVNRKINVKMHLGAPIMCNFLKTALEKKQLRHENVKPYYLHLAL